MESSVLIARLIGPILVVVGLSTLVNPKALHEIGREFLASRALIFIAGFLALLGGLAIVNTHNLWTTGWPVIITIFGWLAVAGGIVRMAFPGLAKSIGEAMLAKETMLRVIAGLQVALGVYLMVYGLPLDAPLPWSSRCDCLLRAAFKSARHSGGVEQQVGMSGQIALRAKRNHQICVQNDFALASLTNTPDEGERSWATRPRR